jgi:hypothetical protein
MAWGSPPNGRLYWRLAGWVKRIRNVPFGPFVLDIARVAGESCLASDRAITFRSMLSPTASWPRIAGQLLPEVRSNGRMQRSGSQDYSARRVSQRDLIDIDCRVFTPSGGKEKNIRHFCTPVTKLYGTQF